MYSFVSSFFRPPVCFENFRSGRESKEKKRKSLIGGAQNMFCITRGSVTPPPYCNGRPFFFVRWSCNGTDSNPRSAFSFFLFSATTLHQCFLLGSAKWGANAPQTKILGGGPTLNGFQNTPQSASCCRGRVVFWCVVLSRESRKKFGSFERSMRDFVPKRYFRPSPDVYLI